MASCTGLSILLIDACRAVGVPARFVGTPLWSDGSGNHSWVEVWDDGWHFTGAAEPTGDALNKAWFTGRAAQAQRDSERYGVDQVVFPHRDQRWPGVLHRGKVAHESLESFPDFLRSGFTLCLQALALDIRLLALRIQRLEMLAVKGEAAPFQFGCNPLRVFSHQF